MFEMPRDHGVYINQYILCFARITNKNSCDCIHRIEIVLIRLIARGQYISALYESGESGEGINDNQEFVEDMLNRTRTREYFDVLKVALAGGSLRTRLSECLNS